MATAAQITANQLNAQHSTGPRTAKGKARSSQNATRHGLATPFDTVPADDLQTFQHLLRDYTREFEPRGCHQQFLVRQMALARTRLERIERLEFRLLEQGAPIEAFLPLQRYSASAERTYHRALRELLAARQIEAESAARKARQDFQRQLDQHPSFPKITGGQNKPSPSLNNNVPRSLTNPISTASQAASTRTR